MECLGSLQSLNCRLPIFLFKVIIGDNFNRFFEIASEGYYVARITESEDMLHIILYRPMVASDFGHTLEVMYAEETI